MKSKKPFSTFDTRHQSTVMDAHNKKHLMGRPATLKFGRILDVYAKDNPNNKVGAYVTYSVMLSPNGVIIDDVPTLSTSGQIIDLVTPNAPSLSTINTEETPYVIGQPVLVGFVNDSNFNPIILGAVGCQFNNSSETTAQHPQKSGSFQNSSWFIDKDGNMNFTGAGTIDISTPSGKALTVKVNGVALLTVKDNEVDIGNGGDTTALWTPLQIFLSTHTHPVAGPVAGPSTTPTTGISTTVLKVQ